MLGVFLCEDTEVAKVTLALAKLVKPWLPDFSLPRLTQMLIHHSIFFLAVARSSC